MSLRCAGCAADLRMQLALLYAGAFFAAGVAVLLDPGPHDQAVGPGSGQRRRRSPRAAPIARVADHPGRCQPGGPGRLSLALGWLIAGRLLRPLRMITATAREISATNLHRRLGLGRRHDEFRELGETLDGLFGRLEASFESQRHFVANASHELRTPLTAERTLLQVALADPDADRGACARPARRCWRWASSRNASSTRCSRWPRRARRRALGALRPGRRHRAGHRRPPRRGGTPGARVDASLAAAPAAVTPAWPRAWWPTWWTTPCGTTCRRLDRGRHVDARRAGDRVGPQQRAGDPARRGRPAVPAVPAARRRARSAATAGTGSAWPSSAPSPTPTAPRSPPAPGPRAASTSR